MKNRKIWYCVTSNRYDAWDYGSTKRREALSMARRETKRDGVEWVELLTIDNEPDPVCLAAERIK